MPLTTKEWELRAKNKAPIQSRAKSVGIPLALLIALEKSKPTRSVPQQIFGGLSKTSKTVHESSLNLINPPSCSSSWKRHEHGVPTGIFRLPLEIREQIYGFVTGHKTVLKIPEDYHKTRPLLERSNNGSINNLLLACRQIYAEASTMVYTRCTFHFTNHNDFLAFAHAINPVVLNQITSLTLDLNSIICVGADPYDYQCPRYNAIWIDGVKPQWSHVWNIIAAMTNLTELRVFLHDPLPPEWEECGGAQCLCFEEDEILAEVWKVKRKMKVFEMSVPWDDTTGWSSLAFCMSNTKGALFDLTRRGITPSWFNSR